MKYIITEQQLNNWKLNNEIINFLNHSLTPIDGFQDWYDLDDVEHFFPLSDDPELDSTDHMWWSNCSGHWVSADKDCPFLVIPKNVYRALDGYFGENSWKPVLNAWFEEHTGLQVNEISD